VKAPSQTFIQHLESSAKRIIEIAFRRFENIAVLFSGGKDSSVLLNLVDQVAKEMQRDYSIVHINTGQNFNEINEFIDRTVKKYRRPLMVGYVTLNEKIGLNRSQSEALNKVIRKHSFEIVFGGGRRCEDKARQKEDLFSIRENQSGEWRPEISHAEIFPWLGLKKEKGFDYRVFPLSDWLEVDVLSYVKYTELEISNLYFSHPRKNGPTDDSHVEMVRFRTIGDKTNSTPILSHAATIDSVVEETLQLQTPERASRLDDRFSEFSMEIRKREGYF
jgi:sulfate adenylyltransferase subunit 2